MSEFEIRINQIRSPAESSRRIAEKITTAGRELEQCQYALDVSISSQYGIVKRNLGGIGQRILLESEHMKQLAQALEDIVGAYRQTEGEITGQSVTYIKVQEAKSYGESFGQEVSSAVWDTLSVLFKDVFIGKSGVISSLLPLVSPVTSILQLTSGLSLSDKPLFFDYSRTPSASANADLFGYKKSGGHPGVTAWVGKASGEAQNEWGYAGVNAYLGKVDASAKSELSIMKMPTKTYQDGKWIEKGGMEFITASIGASASASALAGDIKAGVGNDRLGIEGKASGSLGNAKAGAKGKFSVGEDGINANVKGEAMVSAAEGKASGTINILGLEITGEVGGYAGALGVEGKAGIEDNKFVLKGGASVGIGGSVGIEIGFNEEGWNDFTDFVEEGWNDFIDFVTFWD